MKYIKEHIVFVLILLICTALRFFPLFDYQFTYDELSGLDRTQFDSLPEVLAKGVKIDAHPALIQLLIFYLVKAFGFNTWIIKLPFLLFGHAAIMYAYALGLKNFSKNIANLIAAVFSFSFIFVFYAPIARMYVSGVFFSLGLLYYFFEIYFNKNVNWKNYLLLGLFALLSALNQHINALFAFTVFVSALFFIDRRNLKFYIITTGLTVLCYLPHLSITLYQLSVPGIGRDAGGWLEAPNSAVMINFINVILGTGKSYLVFCLLILISVLVKRKVGLNKRQIYLILIFLTNLLIVYLYSVIRSPIFQYSVMLFAGTAFVVFICSFINFDKVQLNVLALILVCATLLYKSYIKKDYLNQSVKTVFEYQFERTKYYKNNYGDKDVFPLFFDCDTLMRKIYFEKYNLSFNFKMSDAREIGYGQKILYSQDKPSNSVDSVISSIKMFANFISTYQGNYIVMSSSTPLYHQIVSEYFPYLIENTQTQAINFKVFSKVKPVREAVKDKIVYESSFAEPKSFAYSKSALPLGVVSGDEFPLHAKAVYSDVVKKEGQVLLVESKLKLSDKPDNLLECCISTNKSADRSTIDYTSKSAGDFLMRSDSTLMVYSDLFNGTKFETAFAGSELNTYFWNRGKTNFKVLTHRVKLVDYWPKKWQLWD